MTGGGVSEFPDHDEPNDPDRGPGPGSFAAAPPVLPFVWSRNSQALTPELHGGLVWGGRRRPWLRASFRRANG